MGRHDSKSVRRDRNEVKDLKERKARDRISLDDFVHRKGQVRALEEFKYRKQRKQVQTAKALRSYRKVMKQEGYEAGQGASRKRVERIASDEQPQEGSDSEHSHNDEEISKKAHKRRRKMNPFHKSVQKAEEKKLQAKQKQAQMKHNERQKAQKLRERKQRTKLLSKRTKRGQPIMKHMVGNLLHKLEKQKR